MHTELAAVQSSLYNVIRANRVIASVLRHRRAISRMFRKLQTLFRKLRDQRSSFPADQLLVAPIDSPEVLDLLWAEFSKTGNVAVVARIVSVLDWDDAVRNRLQSWLSDLRPDVWATEPYRTYQEMFVRCCFPIDYGRRSIDGPVDLDLHVALLARSGQLKFEELPFPLTQPQLVRLSMKSAALWSLLAMAQQHNVVARVCHEESKKPGGAARLHLESAAEPSGAAERGKGAS